MEAEKVHAILENYIFEDHDDEDVKTEIQERIASLSDDPAVEVVVGKIDNNHEGLLAEVTEHGVCTEFVMFAEEVENDLHPPEDE